MRLWLLLAFCWSPVLAQNLTIEAGLVFDGKGQILHNQQIVIQDSRIVRMENSPASLPPGSLDLRRFTVMPGWIDTHVHLDWHFGSDGKIARQPNQKPEELALYDAENAFLTLQGGFTTVQSVGSRSDVAVRDHINTGSLPGPRILTSVRQITKDSGDPEALRELVRQTKAEGADLIKLFATAGLGAGGAQTMSDAQIEAVCSEARKQGLRSVVHAISDQGARVAVLAGCSSIEHGTLVSEETLALMRERGTYFDPNFLVLHNYLEHLPQYDFTPASEAALRNAIKPTAEVLRRARKKNVKVVLGTDAVAGADGRNAEEFIYRVKEGGDTPAQALLSGTSVAAEALGLGSQTGTLAAGFAADLVAVEGNPLDDITAVRKVVLVMKGGKIYSNSANGAAPVH